MFTAAKHKERRRDARKNGPGGAYAGSAAGRQKIWDKSAARKKAAAEALVRLSNRDRRRRVRFGTNEYKFFDCTKPPNFVSAKMPKLKLKRRLPDPGICPGICPGGQASTPRAGSCSRGRGARARVRPRGL